MNVLLLDKKHHNVRTRNLEMEGIWSSRKV